MITATQLIRNKFPNHDGVFVLRNIEEFMIEFAKLHVEAALKQASEKAKVYSIYEGANEFEEPQFSYEVDKNSILNSYDLNNIK